MLMNACWIEWLRTLQILTTIILNFNAHCGEAVAMHGRSRQGEPNVLVFQAYPSWLEVVTLNITYWVILRVVSSLFNHFSAVYWASMLSTVLGARDTVMNKTDTDLGPRGANILSSGAADMRGVCHEIRNPPATNVSYLKQKSYSNQY